MSQGVQSLTQSQQLVSDLLKKLRHAFQEEATARVVSIHEFNCSFTRVFTGVPNEKFSQIFNSFDEESKGVINYLTFLNDERLPKILLSLHNESISQITLLQQNSSYQSDITLTTDNEDNNNNNMNNQQSIIPTLPPKSSFYNNNNTHSLTSISFDHTKQSSLEIRKSLNLPPKINNQSSYESSVTELEQEVYQKSEEIDKLKEWISLKGIPAQKSVSDLQQRVKNVKRREEEMANEIQQIQIVNDSLKSENEIITRHHQELQSQHHHLLNEHKSLKTLCNEIQKNYDECLDHYNKEKEQKKNLMTVVTDLRKLKDQYETVNNDQAKKIESYKEDINEAREKYAALEFAANEISQENEELAFYINNPQQNVIMDTKELKENDNKDSTENTLDAPTSDNRSRALSAVSEDTESSAPRVGALPKINANADMLPSRGTHPRFNRSASINVSTLDQLTRRYSGINNASGTTPRHSLLNRIRSFTMQTPTLNDSNSRNSTGITPTSEANNSWKSLHQRFDSTNSAISTAGPYYHQQYNSGATPLILDDADSNTSMSQTGGRRANYATMYGGRRRKRTISIVSISTPRKRTLAAAALKESLDDSFSGMGYSQNSGIGANLFNDDDDDGDDGGYADQYHEEIGDDDFDDIDQLQEITDQLRKELQEEMEGELEEQIQREYDLKIMKINSQHNEQLMMLKMEIDRLKATNKKQLKQIKIMERGGSMHPHHQINNGGRITLGNDDEKIDPKRHEEMDDDFDSYEFNRDSADGSDASYDDDDDDDDEDDIPDSSDERRNNSNDDDDEDDTDGAMIILSDDDDDDDEDEDDGGFDDVESKRNYVVMGGYDGYGENETTPMLQEKRDKKKGKKKKDKKSKKEKKSKKDKKKKHKKKEKENMAKKEIKKSGFCCSSIFSDFGKTEVDMEQPGKVSVKSDSLKKHHKKKKHKNKDKEKIKDKDKGKDKGKDKKKKSKKKKDKSKKKHKYHKNKDKTNRD